MITVNSGVLKEAVTLMNRNAVAKSSTYFAAAGDYVQISSGSEELVLRLHGLRLHLELQDGGDPEMKPVLVGDLQNQLKMLKKTDEIQLGLDSSENLSLQSNGRKIGIKTAEKEIPEYPDLHPRAKLMTCMESRGFTGCSERPDPVHR